MTKSDEYKDYGVMYIHRALRPNDVITGKRSVNNIIIKRTPSTIKGVPPITSTKEYMYTLFNAMLECRDAKKFRSLDADIVEMLLNGRFKTREALANFTGKRYLTRFENIYLNVMTENDRMFLKAQNQNKPIHDYFKELDRGVTN
ncbi:hypothetical protein GJU84_11190 [Staphylococcus chromogenes]|uniref:hypothetical protein n=1 Tax=Staphylococcus chromogenes TaxID=46126 RepID=UPI00140453EE|nr:hypothetical protein [Staphylococcus chromogenes]QIN27576.1 hypothetical protein GJU84_11190 [Staphylococcus chromogenes]